MNEIIIVGRITAKEELNRAIQQLAASQGVSFESVKKTVEVFQNSKPMLSLSEEFKRAVKELNSLTFELEKTAKDFPPSKTNPFYRQYYGKKRR